MGFFDKAKCLTGFHDWTEWSYSSSDACSQTRYCRRTNCNKRDTQTLHQWNDFSYTSDGSCDQTRQCPRCKLVEKGEPRHILTDWVFTNERECTQKQTCTRCGEESQRIEHQWGGWDFESPKSCTHIRFCRRCTTGREVKQPNQEDHTWGEPQRIDCSHSLQVCTRCGRESRNFDRRLHLYGPWEAFGSLEMRRYCSECRDYESKPA